MVPCSVDDVVDFNRVSQHRVEDHVIPMWKPPYFPARPSDEQGMAQWMVGKAEAAFYQFTYEAFGT